VQVRRCCGCGKTHPLTNEFFSRAKVYKGKLNFNYRCKVCINTKNKEKKLAERLNSEKYKVKMQEEATGMRVCRVCGVEKDLTLFPMLSKVLANGTRKKYRKGFCILCTRIKRNNFKMRPPKIAKERKCCECGKTYPLTKEFFRSANRQGFVSYQHRCKECCKARDKERMRIKYQNSPVNLRKAEEKKTGNRKCRTCKKVKPLNKNFFTFRARKTHGCFLRVCLVCERKAAAIERSTPEAKKRMKELQSKHYKKNKVRLNAYTKKWAQENPDKVKLYTKKSNERRRTDPAYKERVRAKYHQTDRSIRTSRDNYYKQLLAKGSSFGARDVPQELVEVKKMHVKLLRAIKNKG